MVSGIRTIHTLGLNKGFGSKFRVDSLVRHKTPEGWRMRRPKRKYYYKDEDTSPYTLNDQNDQNSS